MKMTIYDKINTIRKRIKDANLKKTGKNAFAGFTYYELADFLPQTIDLENELGLISMFTLRDNESADLIVCDTTSDSQVVFTVRVREANMKGALEVQKAGAENTYAKRYAYLNYLNLTELDQVDNKDQSKVIDEKKSVAKPTTATKPQPEQPPFMNWKDDAERIAALEEITALLGGDQAKVGKWFNYHHCNHTTITPAIANAIIENIKLKQAKEKAKNG